MHPNPAGLHDHLAEYRSEAGSQGLNAGKGLPQAGTHPMADSRGQRITEKEGNNGRVRKCHRILAVLANGY